jgi:hypothetical protein
MSTSAIVNDGERIKEVIVDSRINKVLAMRTDSVAMLEALDAISEFYVESKSPTALARSRDTPSHSTPLTFYSRSSS